MSATTLPPLTEAMTARDVMLHLSALKNDAPAFKVAAVFSSSGDDAICILLEPASGWRDTEYLRAPAWPEAFALARQWIATHATVHRDNRIRAMALAIIDLTDQHGRCDRAMLTRREFSGAEIDALKDAACVRASEMSANSPFCVEG